MLFFLRPFRLPALSLSVGCSFTRSTVRSLFALLLCWSSTARGYEPGGSRVSPPAPSSALDCRPAPPLLPHARSLSWRSLVCFAARAHPPLTLGVNNRHLRRPTRPNVPSVEEVPAPSHMNWLIHAAYIKKDFETAEVAPPRPAPPHLDRHRPLPSHRDDGVGPPRLPVQSPSLAPFCIRTRRQTKGPSPLYLGSPPLLASLSSLSLSLSGPARRKSRTISSW